MRCHLWIAAAVVPLAFHGLSAPAHAAPSLVAYLTGDGSTADASGNGNAGIAVGSVGYGAGVFGQAFAFDGSSAVVVPSVASLNFGTGDFSYTLRFVGTDNVPITGLISKDDYGIASPYSGWLANNCWPCGGVGSETRNIAAGQDANLRTPSGFADGVWYNFTFVREAGVETAYVNGAAIASFAETIAIDVSNAAPVTIGALNALSTSSAGIQNFTGRIDDVAIFAGALSSSQVTSIYDNGVASILDVPEPVSAAILGAGLLAAGIARRRSSPSRA